VRVLTPFFLVLGLFVTPAVAQVPLPQGLTAEAILLVDTNGKILFSRNADENHAPASLVKMMTLYLAFEDLEAGRVQWEEMITISDHAASTRRYRLRLRAGEAVPFYVLLEAVAIASANDAAAAVAEHLAGSEHAFVERMNTTGRRLGLRHTLFTNPHGLPDPEQRTTAEDVAMLTRRLVEDYPSAGELLGGQYFVFRGRIHGRSIPLFIDPGGVQALKTGFTRDAGYNLALKAWHAGQTYLLVVLGAQTRGLSFRDARRLLHYAFGEIVEDEPEPPHRIVTKPRGARIQRAKVPKTPVRVRR
jgi:D-alanyl-D-alanine carboxypeptidase